MFSFQSAKRQREEDSDSEDERYFKKTRPWAFQNYHNGASAYPALPVRPLGSITPSPPRVVPDLATMTPAQSESNSPASVQDESNQFGSTFERRNSDAEHDADVDMDMDMDETDFDFVVGSPPPDSPVVHTFRLPPPRPAKLDPALFSQDTDRHQTARIPTPMYPSFPGNRGGPTSGGIMPGGMHTMNNSSGLSVPREALLQTPPVSSSGSKKKAYIEQNPTRRMPSPISEDEDLPDTPTTAFAQSKLSRLTVDTIPEHAMDCGEGEGAGEIVDGDAVMPRPPATPTGRKRSGALSSGRGRFRIGYREDCDKCRQRVPGHFAHFLS